MGESESGRVLGLTEEATEQEKQSPITLHQMENCLPKKGGEDKLRETSTHTIQLRSYETRECKLVKVRRSWSVMLGGARAGMSGHR